MLKSHLTNSKKEKIRQSIRLNDFAAAVDVLNSISTKHAGTAKMLDKQFVIYEIVQHIEKKFNGSNSNQKAKAFYTAGSAICRIGSLNAKEVGVHIIWRGYAFKKKSVEKILLQTSDDENWEVREYAAGAVVNALKHNSGFYRTLEKWRGHESENVRRVVVMSIAGLRDKKDKKCTVKAFKLIEPLMHDGSRYVKKNLGPFALGGWYGNAFPEETLAQIDKWLKIKDENVRWNIAMTFNNSFGNRHPKEALERLQKLADDDRTIVRRAVISTLRTLRKRHKALIDAFLRFNSMTI